MLVQFSADSPLFFKFLPSLIPLKSAVAKVCYLIRGMGAILMTWQLKTEDKNIIKDQHSI